MSKITDYAFLFQNSSGKSAFNPIGSFRLSQLNSSAVQSQLKCSCTVEKHKAKQG